jgi:hypothetical protein
MMGTRNHCLGPRQIARFEQAASLLPGLDPGEVFRFYICHTQAGRTTVPLAVWRLIPLELKIPVSQSQQDLPRKSFACAVRKHDYVLLL